MNKYAITFLFLSVLLNTYGQTLEECHHAAERNYPLVSQYKLMEKTAEYTAANIQKGWLPQVTALAQATYQSDVTAWPDEMRTMMNQSGINIKGLKKDQYRIGLDVSQTLYDGGSMKYQKEVVLRERDSESAQTDVSMYALKKRVNELFFSLLLLDEQVELSHHLLDYLESNERKLQSMYENGTASESDYNQMKAERLGVEQQIINQEAQAKALSLLLSTLCGIEITDLVKPSLFHIHGGSNGRPELNYIDSQLRLIDAKERLTDSALLPKVSLFASGYYGYPGYNMFEDMMKHDWSLNGMVGLRVTWNIGALYTHKGDKAKLALQRNFAESNRDIFLFNNRMDEIRQRENVERFQRVMQHDDEIISLRSNVRKASESRLSHGIIDVSDLVKDIKAENDAMTQKSIHEIEILKETYELLYTINVQ